MKYIKLFESFINESIDARSIKMITGLNSLDEVEIAAKQILKYSVNDEDKTIHDLVDSMTDNLNIYIDSQRFKEFQKLYTIKPKGKIKNLDYTEGGILELYIKYVYDYTKINKLKSVDDVLKFAYNEFNYSVTKNKNDKSYEAPIYKMKTDIKPIDISKVPQKIINKYGDHQPKYFSFETSKKFKGFMILFYTDGIVSMAFNEKGVLVGRGWVGKSYEGFYSGSMATDSILVKPKYQRVGVMTAIYDLFQYNEIHVIPSETLAKNARLFWQNREIVNVKKLHPNMIPFLNQIFDNTT